MTTTTTIVRSIMLLLSLSSLGRRSSTSLLCRAFTAFQPSIGRTSTKSSSTITNVSFLTRGSGAFNNVNKSQLLTGGLTSSSSRWMTSSSTSSTTESATDEATPAGAKSDQEQYDIRNIQQGIVGNYDPQSFETDIYQWWEDSKCFQPDAKPQSSSASDKKPYTLPMPPPNVTGRLHMGHVMFVALQDVLARFHRMRGRPVLWLPGTDHAGIATQLQVEKQLAAEGTTRQEVGREEFLRRVWEYKEEQGGFITSQLRRLGASADWSRERFTMDSDLSDAVMEAFVQLNDKGLIYRGEYMVNWAPGLQTAVSDLEVDYTDEEGKLYYFKYMIDGDSEEFLPVATTRPETIFGDTAVCVHPEDDRYKHLIGKEALVPLLGRKIPVIADEYVDREFGTGALKITPGHDPNDYTLGKKHNLDIINIMNKDGSMNGVCGDSYEGLDRFDARAKLWTDMGDAGLVIKEEPHMQRVPRSQRGGEIIEPLVSRQWFCKTEGMGAKALKAVEDGDVQILPARFNKTWTNWLDGIHDWCISRQLWWGHRIPVWYIGDDEENYIVARNEAEAYQIAINERGLPEDVTLRQEEDVLDTWFSSGLWPFATLGWPNEEGNEDLARFYPATCLETGYDILFFWVARMVMMGIELTGKSPFDVVLLHGLVRAADGTKMSKTKGNVLDPLDTIADYGADALRYSLVTGVTPGQDIPLNMDKVEANRNFCNKLWNACKFVTGNALKDVSGEDLDNLAVTGPMSKEEFDSLALPERYIVSKCHALVESVTQDIESYALGAAGGKMYEFVWDQFADWYIEISKTRLYKGAGSTGVEEQRQAQRVLVYVLDTSLRLLHPYMPYVTEHLWHHLPRKAAGDVVADGNSSSSSAHAIMLADWPQMEDSIALVQSADDVVVFEAFQALTRGIRNARAEYNVDMGKKISATIVVPEQFITALEEEQKSLVALCRLDPEQVKFVVAGSDQAKAASESEDAVQVVVQDGIEVLLPLSGLIDPVKEKERLTRQYDKLTKEIEKLAGRLNGKGFVDKAPAAVVDKARDELAELEGQAARVQSSLEALEKN
jgi:valyl-tRNA synthetase